MKRILCMILTIALLCIVMTMVVAESKIVESGNASIVPVQEVEQNQTRKPSEVLSQIFGLKKEEKRDEPLLIETEKNEKQDESQYTYSFDMDVLASIPAIVGYRKCLDSFETEGRGYVEQWYTYESATVRDDLLAYIDYLGENNFVIVSGAPLDKPGDGELINESKEKGKGIRILLDWNESSYTISIVKEDESRFSQSGKEEQNRSEADPIILERGRELIDEGKYDEALEVYNAAIAEQPGIAVYYADRWLAFYALYAYQDAIDTLTNAILLDATNWEYYNNRGYVYYYMNQNEDAIADFQAAMDLDPTNDSAHYSLAYIQVEMGALEDAVLTCAFGISAFPDSGDLWCLLGNTQFMLAHYPEALSAYDKAIDIGVYEEIDLKNYLEAKEKADAASK